MRTWFLILAAIFTISGCAKSGSGPTNLGAGMYTFSIDGWPGNLVKFQKAHPDLRVVCVSEGDRMGQTFSRPTTMLVVTEPRVT